LNPSSTKAPSHSQAHGSRRWRSCSCAPQERDVQQGTESRHSCSPPAPARPREQFVGKPADRLRGTVVEFQSAKTARECRFPILTGEPDYICAARHHRRGTGRYLRPEQEPAAKPAQGAKVLGFIRHDVIEGLLLQALQNLRDVVTHTIPRLESPPGSGCAPPRRHARPRASDGAQRLAAVHPHAF